MTTKATKKPAVPAEIKAAQKLLTELANLRSEAKAQGREIDRLNRMVAADLRRERVRKEAAKTKRSAKSKPKPPTKAAR